jgi:hypothetical protein
MTAVNALTVAWTSLASLEEKVPDPNDVKPGWIGFVVVVGLMVAVVFLLLSFRKQLRRVDFEPPGNGDEPAPANGKNGGSPAS